MYIQTVHHSDTNSYISDNYETCSMINTVLATLEKPLNVFTVQHYQL